MTDYHELAQNIAPYLTPWIASALNITSMTSYTPTYVGGTTPGTTTYTFQDGAYSRMGSLVLVRGQLAWSAATGTGEARISVPVAPSAGNFTGSLFLSGVTFAAGSPQMLLSPGLLYFTMASPATNAVPTTVQVEASANIIFSVAYFA